MKEWSFTCLYHGYSGDSFPHSLLRVSQKNKQSWHAGGPGFPTRQYSVSLPSPCIQGKRHLSCLQRSWIGWFGGSNNSEQPYPSTILIYLSYSELLGLQSRPILPSRKYPWFKWCSPQTQSSQLDHPSVSGRTPAATRLGNQKMCQKTLHPNMNPQK